MRNISTTIGIDIGDKHSQMYVLDEKTGEMLEETRIQTTPNAFRRYFRGRKGDRVVLEVGCHSGWMSRLITKISDSEVLVADPRKARKLMGSEEKDDAIDAEMLARIGRLDPKLLKPVVCRTEQTQCHMSVIKSRDAMVRARTLLINQVRGTVKTVGERLKKCTAESFHRTPLPEQFQTVLQPVMDSIEGLTEKIRQQDKAIEKLSIEEYPETLRLRQIHGVGPITALVFALAIENPQRFKNSRKVGAYFGLCRRRWQSGDQDPDLGISKMGNAFVRRLLVNCAQYIIGPFGPDCDLRRWGLNYAQQGGKKGKKRAVVAVARKLAVLMHRLWISGKDYVPLYQANQTAA